MLKSLFRKFMDKYFRDLPPEVAALTGVSFCVALGFGIVAPIIPVFAKSFNVSALAATAVISVFAFMRFASATPAGWLVNKFGERAVLWSGLSVVAISSALAGFSQSYLELLVLRGLGGTGSSMFTVSAMSLLLRVVDVDHRGRASSTYQSGFLVGGLAGPAVGGIVVALSLRAPFFVYAVTLLGAALVAFFMLPRGLGHPDRDDRMAQDSSHAMPLHSALKLREYWTALSYNFTIGMTSFGLRAALIPLYVTEVLKRGPSLSSLGFLVSSIAQAIFMLPAGRATDIRGRRPVMILGAAALLLSMTILFVSENITGFYIYMALIGISGAYLSAGGSAMIGDIVAGRKGGHVVSTYQMTSDFGIVIGPLVAGLLRDTSGGYALPFGFGLAITAAFFVIVSFVPETRNRNYL